MAERLQKYLARAGVASRRHAEELIAGGHVAVNNATVRELGTKVEPGRDLVTVDGKLVEPAEERAYFILYKPAGVVTTMEDPQGRPTVAEYVKDVGRRVFPVGRLDFDAEGALLFTDDGELAHALTHPSYEVRRTYLAKVKGTPTAESLGRLREGVRLEDGMAKALEAEVFEATDRNTWIRITVAEGRQHLVKRLCAAIGHPLVRLYRPAHAGISPEGLEPGKLRKLTSEEVARVKAVAGGAAPPPASISLPPRRHGRGAPGFDRDEEGDDASDSDARSRPERQRERPIGRLERGRSSPARTGRATERGRGERASEERGRDRGGAWRGREERGERGERPRQERGTERGGEWQRREFRGERGERAGGERGRSRPGEWKPRTFGGERGERAGGERGRSRPGEWKPRTFGAERGERAGGERERGRPGEWKPRTFGAGRGERAGGERGRG